MNREQTFERIVTHERARTAMFRFVDHFFGNGRRTPRASIPVDPDDDDVVLTDYITQREATEARLREALARVVYLAERGRWHDIGPYAAQTIGVDWVE